MKKTLIITLLIVSSIIGQSLNSSYVVKTKITGGANKIGEFNYVEYSVQSISGKELYKIIDKVDYDIPYSKLEVFESGNSVLISSFSGTLTFISNSGSKIRTEKIRESIPVEYERNILSVVDGESMALLFSTSNSEYSTIQIYSSKGTIESEFSIEITNINGVSFSQKLDQIYLSFNDWVNSDKPSKFISIINSNGTEIKKIEANFEKGFFTDSNQFIGYSNKSVFCFDAEKLRLNFQNSVEENNINIGVTYNADKVVVVSAKEPLLKEGKWLYQNPTIKHFDLEGKIVETKEIKSKLFSKFGFKTVDGKKEFYLED